VGLLLTAWLLISGTYSLPVYLNELLMCGVILLICIIMRMGFDQQEFELDIITGTSDLVGTDCGLI
jgi:hypothetical protein